MYALGLLLPVFLAVSLSPAQDPAPPTDTPDLSVLAQKWEKIYRNPALEEDPLEINNRQQEIARVQQENLRQQRELENLRRGGTRQQVIRVAKEPAPPDGAGTFPVAEAPPLNGPATIYIYKAKVKNNGQKTVRGVIWEYIFADRQTNEAVGRHYHRTRVRIRPGKSAELTGHSLSPPARVVNASNAEGRPQTDYNEQVLVHRIEYEDGSSWQRP
jgi:hypothetical protein